MGADHSVPSDELLRSQRDEDIPYTSYSISKPISSGQSKLEGRHASLHLKSLEMLPHNEIITVTDGLSAKSVVDEDEQRLLAIPQFLPLLAAHAASLNSTGQLVCLDVQHVLALCVRFQDHLRQCAEAVAFDQNALCVRMKEVDFAIQSLYSLMTAQQKLFARHAEQIMKINEISSISSRIQMALDQTLPVMERLNSILPADEQLEKFSAK